MTANTQRHDHLELHAAKRARERYAAGPEIVGQVRRRIKRTLRAMNKRRAGKASTLGYEAYRLQIISRNRSLWRVIVDDETYVVVFEHPTQCVVTFLPKDYQP